MPTSKQLPKAPDSLSSTAKKLWKEVVEEFVLERHHLRLLEKALVQWGRAEKAREILDAEGLTVFDRFQQLRSHPLVAEERQSTLAYKNLMRELGLDVLPSETRGPRRPGSRD
jgi:P27 family predicted phage terminase small subunit